MSIIGYVVSRYGRFSATRLSEMTHQEPPWKDVSEQDSEWSSSDDDIISTERISAFFSHLAEVAKMDALAREHADLIRPRIDEHYQGETSDDPDRLRQRLDELRR